MFTYTKTELLAMPFDDLMDVARTIWLKQDCDDHERINSAFSDPEIKVHRQHQIASRLYFAFGEHLAQIGEYNAPKLDQLRDCLKARGMYIAQNASEWDLRLAVRLAVWREQQHAAELEDREEYDLMTREQLMHRLRHHRRLPEGQVFTTPHLRERLRTEIQILSQL